MNEYQVDKNYLLTESDVEQKVIYPLLTNMEPLGLGYDQTEIQTKINLQKILIDKGAKAILYYPDYLITVNGVPSIIIEAKKPEEDLIEAFRQASLYAAELNRKFEKDINPCQLIIACDGLTLLAGSWDSAAAQFTINTSNWLSSEKDFNAFSHRFSKSTLEKESNEIRARIRKNISYKKPLNLLGGKFIQNKPSENSFGETISIQYRHLFNPNVEEERIDIVRNAYVKVIKQESHVNPIDKLIRKKIIPSALHTTEIDDNTKPKKLIDAFQNAHNYNNQVLLLVGSVGSGKTTFTTYLKEVALEKNIVSKLTWITLDLNNAPVTAEEIYTWLKKSIVSQIQKDNPHTDFNNIDIIQKIYTTEINKLKSGVLQLLNPESDRYREILVEKIIDFQGNIDITLSGHIEQFVHGEKKELIIILDNTDKRNLEEQLLMFEVANWIKDSIKAIVFLPIRDTTFDHFRKEKPLDTVIKDLIFRINPPSLEKVLFSRIKYASRLSEKNKDRFYYLPNNIKVNYPAAEELYYLKGILTSLFQNNFFRRLISGLAGSDIRIGLEIFLDFCKSGHISESEIYKMKQSKGQSKLPNHIVSKVFLRGNKVYYNDVSARIKNLFHSEPSDELPDPFVRISILKWLFENHKIKGPSGIPGFHLAEVVLNNLISLGHNKNRIKEELITMLRHSLIISESQKTEQIDYKELISINTPGIIHLELITNMDYLGACAEDTWYNVVETATRISANMSGEGQYTHLSLQNILEHSELLINYLESYFNKYFKLYSEYLARGKFFDPLDFQHLRDSLNNFKIGISRNKYLEIKIGTKLNAKIVNIKNYGVIVELEGSDQTGLVHVSQIEDPEFENTFKIYDEIKVEILRYNIAHKKYDLKLTD
jgi:hypothetical protein